MSVNMLIESDGVFNFTQEEFAAWALGSSLSQGQIRAADGPDQRGDRLK
jgi:hypothetical protein